MSGQLHAVVALFMDHEPLLPIEEEAEWALWPVGML